MLQEVDLPIINNTMCEDMYRKAGYVEHIPKIFICAGYARGEKDSCEVKYNVTPYKQISKSCIAGE